LARTLRQITELRKALEEIDLQRLNRSQPLQITTTHPATAASTSNLGLGNSGSTAAVLQSTEQVNATPTSFSPFGPSFTGLSTSLPTVGGVYNGQNGTDTLTFRVTAGGVIGLPGALRIDVRNSQSNLIETLQFDNLAPDTPVTLQNGLTLSLGAGTILADDSFTVNVYSSVGSVVDPNKPFNGTRNNNPNLQNGFSVTAGSFTVNGTNIAVNASDSINDVLTRITNSSAGVTATFDAGAESVVLTQKTPGSAPTIALANDTSGFLAATKLAGATVVPGQDGVNDSNRPLAQVARFSSAQSGTLTVNGVNISINVNADSLNAVLNRINTSGAGVNASLDSTAQRVSVVSQNPANQLVLNSGGTGFFPAVEISDGIYNPTQGSQLLGKGVSDEDIHRTADAVKDAARALNALFADLRSESTPDPFLTQLQNDIQSTVSKTLNTKGSLFRTNFGVHFDFFDYRNKRQEVFDFSLSNRDQLVSSLQTSQGMDEVRNLFFGADSSTADGLVERLITLLNRAESDLKAKLKSSGSLVDLVA
jgi:hypothetical protein